MIKAKLLATVFYILYNNGVVSYIKSNYKLYCNSKCSSKLYIIAEIQLKLYFYDEKPVFKLSYLNNALFDSLLSTSILSKICNNKSTYKVYRLDNIYLSQLSTL